MKAFEDQNVVAILLSRGFGILQVFAVAARAFEPYQPSEFDWQHFHRMHRSAAHRTIQRITIHNDDEKASFMPLPSQTGVRLSARART